MSKPTTPLDSELAKIFGNNTRIFRAMRELFKQAGDLSPAAIEEALIAAGIADSKAIQALDILNRIANSVELSSLAPQKENIKKDDLTPRQEFIIPDTLADLSPKFEEDQAVLKSSDIGVTVQAFSADLNTYAANPLTAAELGQLQNINTVTISNAQWVFLGAFNQGLRTTSTVTFNAITSTTTLTCTSLISSDAVAGISLGPTGTAGKNRLQANAASIDMNNTGNASLMRWSLDRSKITSGGASITDLGSASLKFKDIFLAGNLLGDTIVRPGNFTTAGRPTPQGAGSMIFDTTLGIPIWHDGTNWIDATGTTV